RPVYNQMNPIVELLRPIPPLAWIPLSILWFGLGDEQNQFIIFLGMFFPILINTIMGVRNIEPNLVRAARSLGASERRVLTRIVLRAHCRRSSPASASPWVSAGWRWSRRNWSAPIRDWVF